MLLDFNFFIQGWNQPFVDSSDRINNPIVKIVCPFGHLFHKLQLQLKIKSRIKPEQFRSNHH